MTKVILTDSQLLNDLLDTERLTNDEVRAFESMAEELTSGKYAHLTDRQRAWAEGVHGKLGLDPGAANLVSSGQVVVTEAQRQELREFTQSLGPKRLRPPGR
jgi:hypothetical protein